MQSWTIKVIVVRVDIPYQVSHQSKKVQKIIFADEKGTCIFGILYDRAVDDLAGFFFKNKAYTIPKGRIQKVNTRYDYVHPTVELWLDNRASISEVDGGIEINMDYNFKSFEEITKEVEEQIGKPLL
ncbi:hypothetical protein LIER_39207 [Lithospermum erythrorhizon]|uniref:Replication protein A1 n=1 Tax=Lithospermum erythrorhizon TaxID=34254 RepID=A0AAV3QDP2_LITER